MIINFNQYLKENNNSEYDYLISLLNKIKNVSYSFDNFKTIIEYYGVRNEEMVDVKDLINTERVSGREVKTTGPINVVKDIRNGKMYIIDGHNRTQQAKNNNQEKISAVVSKGYFDKKDSYFDPEVNILAQKYNINLEEFYNGKLTESLLDKFESFTEEEAYQNLLDKSESIDDVLFNAANADFVYGVKKALEQIEKEGDNGINFPNLALTQTIIYGSLDVLKYLIEEKNADVNGYYGNNLEAAASNNHPDIIKYLIGKGANVHVNGDGPLWRAVSKGYLECAKILLDNGATIEGYMIDAANKNNNTNMIELLNKYSIKESLLDKLQGPTKEDVLKNYKIDGNIDTVESLLDYIIKNSNKKMYDSTRHENAFVYYFLNRKNMFIVNIYENECLITKILSDLLNIFNVSKEEKIKKVKDYLYQHDIITDTCKVKINY